MSNLRTRASDLARTILANGVAAARWRGPAGDGQPLAIWAGLCAVAWLWCWLLAPEEPLLALLPPVLAAGVFLPAFEQALSRESAWLRRLEVPLVLLAHAVVAVEVWGSVLARHTIHAADHWANLDHIETLSRALREGRWPAWTHTIQGGDSVGYLYPVLLDLQTAIAHRLIPGDVTLLQVYTGVVIVWWSLRGVAVYFLARRFANAPISGLFALASLFDVGGHIMDGNWFAALGWGVFHSNAALTIALFALASHIDVSRGRLGGRLLLATGLAALAGIAHPLGLLVMMLIAGSSVLSVLVARGPQRGGVWATVSVSLGLMMVAFYTVPSSYLLGQYGFHGGAAGNIINEAGNGILRGNLPDSSFSGFNGFAAIAVLAAVTTRQVPLLTAALCALFLWAIEQTPVMIESGLLRHAPGMLLGQARRALGPLKMVAVVPMAWLASLAFTHLGRPRSTTVHAVLTRSLILFLVLWSFGRSITSAFYDVNEQLRQQVTAASRPGPDHRAAFGWLRARREEDRSPTLWRVAILWKNARHAAWIEGQRTGVPIVDYAWLSGNFLTFRPRERTLEGFRDWSIRYAMTDYPTGPVPGMKEVARMGIYVIWENPLYDARSVVAPPGVSIEDLVYAGDEIRFKVKGAPSQGAEIVVRTAWFPRWRARQNGREISLYRKLPRPEAKPKQDQIALLAHDGQVLVSCDRLPPRTAFGSLISLLGLLGVGFISRERRRQRLETAFPRYWRRFQETLARVRPTAGPRMRWVAVAFAVVTLVALSGWWRGRRVLAPTSWPVASAKVLVARGGRLVPCASKFWRARINCGTEATINWWVGYTRVNDDAGEWPRYWPGTQIVASEPHTDVRFQFGRARLAGGNLRVKVLAVGGCRLTVRSRGRTLGTKEYWNGDREDIISLAAAGRAPAELELSFESLARGTRIVFDAKTE